MQLESQGSYEARFHREEELGQPGGSRDACRGAGSGGGAFGRGGGAAGNGAGADGRSDRHGVPAIHSACEPVQPREFRSKCRVGLPGLRIENWA